MRKLAGIFLVVTAIGASFAAPAKADVIYNLTFDNNSNSVVGTGVLDLNFATVAQTYNLNQSLNGILVSITTTNLDGNGVFSITPSNLLAGSQFQTGNIGQIYTLTAASVIPPSNLVYPPTNILILDLYTSSWQIHGQYNSTIDSGKLLIGAPQVAASQQAAAVPEPLTLSLFGTGVIGAGVMRRRRKKPSLKA